MPAYLGVLSYLFHPSVYLQMIWMNAGIYIKNKICY